MLYFYEKRYKNLHMEANQSYFVKFTFISYFYEKRFTYENKK